MQKIKLSSSMTKDFLFSYMKMKTKKRKDVKKTTQKNKRAQRGGIRIVKSVSPLEAFKYFIENSTFSYYKRGFFGVLVLAKLKEGVQSPYRHIRTNGIAYVKHLLLKFFELKLPEKDIKNMDSSDIQREIDIQQTIYRSSLRSPNTLLEPICPCIVYSHSEALTENCKQSFYKIIQQSVKNNKQIDQVFQGKVAFFAMEFMENYTPLTNYANTFSEIVAINKSLYALDKLHALEFMHNDFHDDNVLFNKNYNYFGFEKDLDNGRAIIIDFGRSNQITHPKIIDNNYRLKLLQSESNYAHDGLFYIFNSLDEKHKLVQDKYIAIFEKHYKCNVQQIINSYNFYIGGNMETISNSKFAPLLHNRCKNKDNNIADQAEEDLKRLNPEKYDELMNSIKQTLEEEKQQPGYVKKLFANQMNELIDPAFVLPVDDDPNKLRLILD
jgi:hypothetical protein